MKHLKTFTQINELNKSTYFSAAKKSEEKGRSEIANKFTKHANERGEDEGNDITFSDESGITFTLSNIELDLDGRENSLMGILKNSSNDNYSSGVGHKFKILMNLKANSMRLYLSDGSTQLLPNSVKDARYLLSKLLSKLEEQDAKVNFSPKDITKGYTKFD